MDKKVRKGKRFVIAHRETQGFEMQTIILIDKETGVHYLFSKSGYGAGLTPLLDKEGKPVINK